MSIKSTLFLFLTLFSLNMMAQTPRELGVKLLKKNLRLTGLNQAALDSYIVTDAYPDQKNGTFMVYLQQTYQGIPVYRRIGTYTFKNDTLVSKTANFFPIEKKAPGIQTTPAVDGIRAIRSAAGHLSIALSQEPRLLSKDDLKKRFVYSSVAGLARHSIPSDLVWSISPDEQVKLAWNVRIGTADGNQDWVVRVDAQTGEVIEKSSLIVSEKNQNDCVEPDEVSARSAPSAPVVAVPMTAAVGGIMGTPSVNDVTYLVYPFPLESANYGSRVTDPNPWLRAGSGNNATTLGWHYDNTNNYSYTRGNNVWAQEDMAGLDNTTGLADTSLTSIPSLTFSRALDNTKSPIEYSNLRAGIDNLFYWNNLMHDISYQYGFDEAAGNFQASNQGRGGAEGDYVDAFAQSGGGINNANFGTPPDGENPIMRMYAWNTGLTYTFHVNAPAPAINNYTVYEGSLSSNSRLVDRGPITATDIVYVNDAVGGLHQACGTISNAAALSGKIALIDRGGTSCPFTLKVKNAQNAGAVAVIVANNANPIVTMTATPVDTTIHIPALMISQTDGNTLKANLTSLNGTLSTSGVLLDGALDNGVMSHEYTHGISNRLTGGPGNTDCLANAEQMGEGWSDFMALMVTTDWSTATTSDGPNPRPLGTYVLKQSSTGGGIRTYPYSTNMTTNPWTYGMLAGSTGGEVHTIGEIWCATLWDMTWNIIQQEGIDGDLYHGVKGNNIALQLVMTGMKLQPCSPGFIDGRDAILKADSILYDNRHKCAIWQAFARRGMGKSASQGSSSSYTDQTAATDLPTGVGINITSNKTILGQGDNVTYTIKASCNCQAQTGVTIVDTLSSGLSYVSSTGGSGGVYNAPYVTWSGNDFTAGETKTFTVLANVAGVYKTPDTAVNDTREGTTLPSWTQTISNGANQWNVSTTRAHSGTHSWYAVDIGSKTDFAMTTTNSYVLDTVSTLSFWHYYETDPSYDGGVVEISTDAGSTWQDLGPYMTQNGYNTTISPLYTNNLANRSAFSGSSGGTFVLTNVALDAFAGKTAKIRFRFGSDNAVSDDGWYVDDIVLTNESGTRSISQAFSGATLLASKSLTTKYAVTPLPVNFLSFEAKKQGAVVGLHWVVNNEINVDSYVIERSGDGSVFTAIGTTAENATGDYAFTDAQPLSGRNFYRIRELDRDGRPTFSAIRVVQFGDGGLVVRVVPVPTYTNSVQLEIETGNAVAVKATLMNTVGVSLKTFAVKSGVNQLSLAGLAKGVYFLKVETSAKDVEIKRVIIQ
ncbi:MAG: M36 family metallopeptidase [Bacteroidetes bacterium]|nr:M36 family metallopeptidase [Bacteroidota bacterium]